MFDAMKKSFGAVIGVILGCIAINEIAKIADRLGYGFKNESKDFEDSGE